SQTRSPFFSSLNRKSASAALPSGAWYSMTEGASVGGRPLVFPVEVSPHATPTSKNNAQRLRMVASRGPCPPTATMLLDAGRFGKEASVKIHAYQGKELLKRYGVPVPKGKPAMSLAEAEEAIRWVQKETGNQVVVVKAQIHAGGRGKGGGVKVAKGFDDATAK